MPKSTEQTPGQRLKDLRLAKGRDGWPQHVLAVRARVAVATVARAERDEIRPSDIIKARIARALGVDRREIWPDEERTVAS